MALTITKAYAAGTILTEAQIDNFRTGLHTLFNSDKFSAGDFDPAMTLTMSMFSDTSLLAADNTYINFGAGNNASLGTDSSKNMVFTSVASTTELQFIVGTDTLEFYTDKVNLPGDVIIGAGGALRTVLQALSSYKKPVIEWLGDSDISIQNNTGSLQETVIYFPTFVAAVEETIDGNAKYRVACMLANANGYAPSHTGAAKGGRRDGLAVTTNSWYFVYAAKVRYGDDYDADNAKFILVFDDTMPTNANEATLDTRYGEGCWVYLGAVRYGYGVDGSAAAIIKFVYSNKGWCYFYGNDTGSTYCGLNLSKSSTDADDSGSPFFTLTAGTSGNTVPSMFGHLQMAVRRSKVSDWYIKDSSGDVIWRGGWQTEDTGAPHGFVVELPFHSTASEEYTFFQVRKGTGAVDRRVQLLGFSDGYLALRRQGHGI